MVALVPLAAVTGCASGSAASTTAAGSSDVRPVADSSGRRSRQLESRLEERARPTPAGVRLRITAFETFVPGNTRDEFLAELRMRQAASPGFQRGAQRPKSTMWNFRWDWQQRIEGLNCTFRNVTVTVDYQTHFVRLSGPIADDPVIQEWWAAQTERTVAGRVTQLIALRDVAREIQRTLRPMFSVNCTMLANEANRTATRLLQEHSDRFNVDLQLGPPAATP
jgi:hypothetical protein